MRALLLILLFYPFVSMADSCPNMVFSTKSLYITIDVDCGRNGDSIISIFKKTKNGQLSNQKMYEFKDECSFTFDKTNNVTGFVCHIHGRTPFAGAKYKLKRSGTYIQDCGEIGSPTEMPRMRYVCISGCGKFVPKVLDQEDPCD